MNEHEILAAIGRIHRRSNKFIERELKRHQIHGIAPSHGDILFQLYTKEFLTMNQLSCSIDRDKSTITALVEKLVHLGYVNKGQDPQDGRVYRLSLTDKGRELQPVFDKVSEALLAAVYEHFTADEKAQLMGLLNKIGL
ncbi:MarR family winged helix-turn-helix transcriptional regulator [Paenibacillus albidus]|nr:MarR family transcriptional regulator [Paenibacillus albidus]